MNKKLPTMMGSMSAGVVGNAWEIKKDELKIKNNPFNS
jgi:hypothetical protein